MLLCNVCKLIQTCKYGVTDISASGTNVMYELGLMHAVGVHCAIVKDRRASQASDIQGLFFLEYSNPQSLAERLARWIEDQVTEAVRPSTASPRSMARLTAAELAESARRRDVLVEYFDDGELRDLCFELKIAYDDLPGTGKKDRARELVAFCERHDRTADLIGAILRLRPNAR